MQMLEDERERQMLHDIGEVSGVIGVAVIHGYNLLSDFPCVCAFVKTALTKFCDTMTMFWKSKKPKAPPGKPSRADIIAQAKASMSAARAEIGDETLDKIKEALLKKQASAIERAKAEIRAADTDKVRDHLQFMMREER